MCPSIGRIQEGYFAILKDYFRDEYDKLRNGRTPHEIANESIRGLTPVVMDSFRKTLHHDLSKHWRRNYSEALEETTRYGGIRAYYEAPVGYQPPLFIEGYIRRVSLYADTVIIADPISDILRVRKIRPDWIHKIVVSAAMELLKCKSLAETDRPIVAVLPKQQSLDLDIGSNIARLRDELSLDLTSRITGKEFSSWDDLDRFVLEHTDLHSLSRRIAGYIRTEEPSPTMIISDEFKEYPTYFSNPEATYISYLLKVGGYSFSDFVSSTIINSNRLGAYPFTDNRTFWRWIMEVQRMSNDKLRTLHQVSIDEMVLNVLQLVDFKWLGNVPVDSIRNLREEGEMQEIRDVFRRELNEIENADDSEFSEVAKQVKYNLETAFKRHEEDLNRLNEKYARSQKWNFSGIVVGSILAASAIYNPLVALVAAAVGGGGFISLMKDYFEARKKDGQLRKKPIGVLFEAGKT